MFTHHLTKDNQLYGVIFSEYAKTHFLKEFKKKYKGKVWDYTELSLRQDLSRLSMENNKTQYSSQVDELKYKNPFYIVKYDFKIAGTKESTKTSGNRCICHIDSITKIITILLIYNKNDLPKNQGETEYIFKTIREHFKEYYINFGQD